MQAETIAGYAFFNARSFANDACSSCYASSTSCHARLAPRLAKLALCCPSRCKPAFGLAQAAGDPGSRHVSCSDMQMVGCQKQLVSGFRINEPGHRSEVPYINLAERLVPDTQAVDTLAKDVEFGQRHVIKEPLHACGR